MKRFARVAAGTAALAALLVLAVHTPPVRRLVLRYVVAEVQRRYGIRIQADRLDYNLASLNVGLSNVRVAADATPQAPFFSADYASVSLPARALTGAVAFKEIVVIEGHVRIVRDASGHTNLPAASSTPAGEPAALDVARVLAPRFAVDVTDAVTGVALAAPSVDIDIGRAAGRVSLGGPATLTKGDVRTRIGMFDGGAMFDGRALTLSALQLRSDEASARVDGALSLLVREPSLDVRAGGAADVEQLARWIMPPPSTLPRGQVAFTGHVTGPLAAPMADLELTSSRLAWERFVIADAHVTSQITSDTATIRDAQFVVANGRVRASGTVPFTNGTAHVTASWSGIDAANLTTAIAGTVSVAPEGALSGSASASGPLASPARWAATISLHADAGVTRAGRVAIPGDTRLQLADGRWRIDAHHRLGDAVPIALEAGGQLDEQALSQSTIAGRVDVADARVSPLLRVLRGAGVADVADGVVTGGTVAATVALSGRLASPRIDAEITGRNLAGARFSVTEARAVMTGIVTGIVTGIGTGIVTGIGTGIVTGDPVGPALSFSARSAAAVIADQQLVDLEASGRLNRALLTIDRVSASQSAQPGTLMLAGSYDLDAKKYTANADVHGWTVVATEGQPLDATVDATFRGAGTLSAPFGSGSLRIATASWRGAALGDLVADVQLDGQAATIAGRAPSLNTTIQARTSTQAPYNAVGDVAVDQIDLTRLVPSGAAVAIRGTLTGTAHAEGPLETWRDGSARVELTALDAHAGDLPISLTAPARVDYTRRQLRIDRIDALAGATRLSASGELPGQGVQLSVDGDIGEAARAVAATGLATLPVTHGSGPLTMRARVSGTIEAPVVTGDVRVGPGSVDIRNLSTASDIRLQAHLERDVVTLSEAHAAYEGATLDATGSVPLALFDSTKRAGVVPGSLHATATGITPAVLHGIVDPAALADLAGAVDVALNLESPSIDLAGITGDLTLTRLDLQMAGLPVVQRTPTRIVARDGFARIESWNWAGEGATVGVFGQVRLSDRQAALIANGDIDLRVLTPFVRSAGLATAGHLSPKFSLTGPLDAPRIDGDVALDGGEVRMLDPRIVVNGLTGRATLTRTTATIRTLTGSINGGPLTGGGSIDYQPDAGLSAQLTADIRDMALDFPAGLRSELNAMLQLTAASVPGAAAPRGMLTGTVEVQRGAYREPLAVVTGLLAAMRARQQTAQESGAGSQASAPFLDRLALDVRLQTDEDVIVDNNYARVQLAADVNLIGTAAAPGMSGRATIRDGGRLFVGRNIYTVKPDPASTVDFVSPDAIEPELDVHLTTRVSGEDIDLDLTGPAEAPQVAMSSSEGDSEADITALLLTGRKLDDLGTADAAFIGTQVIGNLSGEVLGFAGRAIGLDTLRLGGVDDTTTRVDPGAIAQVVDPTSRLTFGKALGTQVDLTFSQSLRDATAQTWIVEYLPRRGMNLRFVSGDTDLQSYAFQHDVSFGNSMIAARTPATRAVVERVSEVNLTGQLVLPEMRVRAVLKLRAGDRFDFARWQDDRDRLETFYHQDGRLAARVTASRATNGSDVKLTYLVEAGPQTTIAVTGVELSRDELARLADAWAASIFDEFLVDEATQIVKGALAIRGYLQPAVSAHMTADTDAKTLHIDVQPGVRSLQVRISLQPGDASLTGDLEARIAERHLDAQVVADPGSVTRDLTAYLRARGYVRAQVTAASPRVDESVTTVPMVVNAGPLFTIASVAFEGSNGIPANDLAMTAALATGMPYDPGAIDAARGRLVALYRTRGFPTAEVESHADVAPDDRVALAFVVREHAQQTIGDVVVTGNGGVNADVVTRALGLAVGAPLQPAELVRARARVFGTGLFRRVDVTTEMMARVDPADATQPMRVHVNVEPWPALRLRYGFQIAQEHPEDNPTGASLTPGLSADVSRRTLFGRALSLEGAVQYEQHQNFVRGLLNAPSLWSLPIQSSLVVERDNQQSIATPFITNTRSVSWEQRLQKARHLALSYWYRFERDHTFGTEPDPLTGLPFDVAVNVARLIGTAAWDTRNDPLDAIRGSLYSSSVQWGPSALGSQFRFLKYVGQAYRFQGVHRVVLASAARVGLVAPLGGQELILSERFFAGGSRTVRGVKEGALGERDIFGDPAGGEAMLIFNQEARVPLYKWLGGVAFVDAGNVFRQTKDVRLSDLTVSFGFGVRVSTPFALLRADYGKVQWPGITVAATGSALRSGQFVVGIGQAF